MHSLVQTPHLLHTLIKEKYENLEASKKESLYEGILGSIRYSMQFFKRNKPLKDTFSSLLSRNGGGSKKAHRIKNNFVGALCGREKNPRLSARKRPRILRLIKTASEESLMTLKTIYTQVLVKQIKEWKSLENN